MTEPIAIIGLACRFAGAGDPSAFWRLLRDGRDAIGEVPPDRWDVSAYYSADASAPGKTHSRRGGFLEQIDRFDAEFFRISPREAVQMDPQHRLMLELAWEALEDAGLPTPRLEGTATGVFIGAGASDYAQIIGDRLELIQQHTTVGQEQSAIAARIAYSFGLHGPNLIVNTGCSSALVAVHLACASLRSGESTLALAGGVNLIVGPRSTVLMAKFGALSPDGRCKSFDARADGYVRADGGGVVVLKSLQAALADRDPIYCVIRGSAVNNDGRSDGLTAPSQLAQEAVLRQAYENAGVSPRKVYYVEAHGTGTAAGDPIEARALGLVLGVGRPADRPLLIGSAKTNVGHAETAAGMAGLIKAALAIQHRLVPASLHFEQPNPRIPFAELGLRVPRVAVPWPDDGEPAIVGVNSFGYGGTNCHVVLEEPVARGIDARSEPPDAWEIGLNGSPANPNGTSSAYRLLPFSAHSPAALSELARRVATFAEQAGETTFSLDDLGYTTSARRSHHAHRLAVVARSSAELVELLRAHASGEPHAALATGRSGGHPPRVVFIFSGQGGQWDGMGRDLFATEPVFRHALEECAAVVRRYVDWSPLAFFADRLASAPPSLDQIDRVQPTLFSLQVALAALWRSWGVVPDAVIGHSMGEVAAAHVAGALSLDDAARVIGRRSRLLRRLSGLGAMAAVELPIDEARAALKGYEDRLAVAICNSATSTVLSGDPVALAEVLAALGRRDVFCRPIQVDVASHSPQMDSLLTDLRRLLIDLSPGVATLPMYSTVTGAPVRGTELDAAYWADNLRQPVLFAQTIDRALAEGYDAFVEIGPHPVLVPVLAQSLALADAKAIALPSLRRGQPGPAVLLGSLGALYAAGYDVAWPGLYPDPLKFVRLPTYPWQRERFWLDAEPEAPRRFSRPAGDRASRHPLLGRRIRSALADVQYESEIAIDLLPVLADHQVAGAVVLPSAVYLEIASAAARDLWPKEVAAIEDLVIREPLVLGRKEIRTLQLIATPAPDRRYSFQVFSAEAGGNASAAQVAWTLHASGTLGLAASAPAIPEAESLTAARSRCAEDVSVDGFYESLRQVGLEYGPCFRGIERLWRRDGEAVGIVRLPEEAVQNAGGFALHPAVLDACLQVGVATGFDGSTSELYLPIGVGQARLDRGPDGPRAWLWSHARIREETSATVTVDCRVYDATERLVAEIVGFQARRTDVATFRRATTTNGPDLADPANWLYEISWQPKSHPPAGHRRDRQSNGSEPTGPWLILADATGVGAWLAQMLTVRGDPTVLVRPGDDYRQLSDREWSIDPTRPDDVRRLLADVSSQLSSIRGVVYLWSLDAAVSEETAESSTRALAAAQTSACRGLLYALQALVFGTNGHHAPPPLWVVTRGAQTAVPGFGPLAIAQTPSWGLARAIASEHPELGCVRVDLDPALAADVVGSTRELFQEMTTGGWRDDEDQIAWRDGIRYVPRLVRSALPPAATHASENVTIGGEATYLITGGLGALGLRVARWLVDQGARHLVLVGRRGLVGASEPAREAVRGLERAGARVRVIPADVAQFSDVARMLNQIESTLPPLCGIVHAAGVLNDAVLANQTWEQFEDVMAPKVLGAWNLNLLSRHLPLDFFLLFSSIASLVGTPGQGNYATANAFLDGLAHHRRRQGRAALGINWGPWSGGGMVLAVEQRVRRSWAALGMGYISPPQGLEFLDRHLRTSRLGPPQVSFVQMDWARFFEHFSTAGTTPLLTTIAAELSSPAPDTAFDWSSRTPGGVGSGQDSDLREKLLASPPRQRHADLLEHVRENLARVLGYTSGHPIDPDRGFADLGMDSLMSVELRNRIQVSLRSAIPVTAPFDYPSIQLFGDFLFREVLVASTSASGDARNGHMDETNRGILAEIEALTDDEVEKLLTEKLRTG